MDAAVWTTDEQGRPCSCAISVGMEEDRFYLFDAEAVLSASRAIEELALEEASGSLLATMQDFKYFAPYRERYWRLAATLDRVRVIAKGRTPPSRDHVKFLACVPRALAPFWTVLYEGVRTRALLICRQTNGTDLFERKRFVGFYTLDASQIARVRHDIEQILAGKRVKMVEFERLMAIDRAAKRIDAFFDRERKEVESA